MYTSFLGVSSRSSSASPGDLDPGVAADLESTGEPALLLISSCKNITLQLTSTVKPVLSGHSKIDKTKILMTNISLMKVKSIAECSHWSILQFY